jgi:hypothetical protein
VANGLAVVVQIYNPSTQEADTEDHEFEASLGDIERPWLIKQTKDVRNREIVHSLYPSFFCLQTRYKFSFAGDDSDQLRNGTSHLQTLVSFWISTFPVSCLWKPEAAS